jgi:hypothetical protein
MNDEIPLKPWLDDPHVGPEVRDLLRLGQVDGPSDADLARLASRLAPAVGLAVLAAPTRALAEVVAPANPAGFAPAKVAVAQGLGLKALLPGLVKVVAVVGTVGLTAMLWPKAPSQPGPVRSTTHAEQRAVEAAPGVETQAAPAPAPSPPDVLPVEEAAPAAAAVPSSKTKDKADRRAKPSATKVEPIQPLSSESELTLIRRAQDLRHQPAQMLSVLTTHERSYPNGMLVQEREVLAIEALLATGKRDEAEKRAARMEQRFSDSAHLRRVRVLLETPTPE